MIGIASGRSDTVIVDGMSTEMHDLLGLVSEEGFELEVFAQTEYVCPTAIVAVNSLTL